MVKIPVRISSICCQIICKMLRTALSWVYRKCLANLHTHNFNAPGTISNRIKGTPQSHRRSYFVLWRSVLTFQDSLIKDVFIIFLFLPLSEGYLSAAVGWPGALETDSFRPLLGPSPPSPFVASLQREATTRIEPPIYWFAFTVCSLSNLLLHRLLIALWLEGED